jgi:hypothetical protein
MRATLKALTWRSVGWALLVGVWIISFIYASTPLDGEVLCLFRRVTGWSCPGCGMTRAFCAMSNGDILTAFDFHLAGPFVYSFMVAVIVLGPFQRVGGAFNASRIPTSVSRFFWALFIILYIGQAIRAASTWSLQGDFPSSVL